MPLIQLQDICKTYGSGSNAVHALRELNLQIQKREFVAIIGASGSGKSSLMNIIGLMDRWDSGTYHFNENEISNKTSETQLAHIRAHSIGFVFQNFNLMPKLTVLENVLLPTRFSGKKNMKLQATQLLDRVGLSTKFRQYPSQLSGGEKQRVAIARALINTPQLILADEPTGALDSQNVSSILNLFKELNSVGHTIVVVTHDPAVANYCDRRINIMDGKAHD